MRAPVTSMRIIESRRPLGACSHSESSNASQVTNMWRKNPFAVPESTTEGSKELTTVYDEDHLAVCPTEPIVFEYAHKSRPVPIYEAKQQEEYWTFLKSGPDVPLPSQPAPSRCPSLVSGSALSSRNSSTRSTRSSVWEPIDDKHNNVRGICLIPECGGLCFKDVSAHTRITHSMEQRVELCPVTTCERYLKGFSRAGEKRQHTFTHFKGSLICGFCEPDPVSFSQAPDRVNLFLTHLIKHHGVQAQHPDQEVDSSYAEKCRRRSTDNAPVSNCSICSEPFTAQVLYEHLPGCVLRHVARNQDSETLECSVASAQETRDRHGQFDGFKKPLSRITSEDRISISQDKSITYSTKDWIESIELEGNEVAEITASSRCLSLTSSKLEDSSEEETDWTEEVTSRESSPGISQLPRRLSPTKRKIVEKIMHQFQHLFQEILRKYAAGDSSSGSSYNGSGGWSSNASTYSSASFVSRKRSLSGGGSLPPNDEDDSNKRRRPDPKLDNKPNTGEPRFACPYYKRNPGRHPTFTSCRDPGFVTIARLKEHLYRRHVLPPQCHRCCTTFANDVVLREHQRDVRGCQIQESMPLEGFDKDQERRLKSKKRSQTYQSEEEKWRSVYQILFPDDTEADMPNPYIEYQSSTNETLEQSNVTRFQEFSRLELPRLVRRTLETAVEQEAQPLEDKLKERLVDIVKECQTQLVALFEATASSANDGAFPVAMTLTTLGQDSLSHQSYMAATPTPFDAFPNFEDLPLRTMQPPDMMRNMANVPLTTVPPCSESPDSGYHSTSTTPMFSTTLYSPPPLPPPTQPLPQPPTYRSCNRTHHPLVPHASSPSLSIIESPPLTDIHAITTDNHDHVNANPHPHKNPNPDIHATANEYIDLEGYYGLFESRDPLSLPSTADSARMDSDALSGWSFICAGPNGTRNGNANGIVDPGMSMSMGTGVHDMTVEEDIDVRRGGGGGGGGGQWIA